MKKSANFLLQLRAQTTAVHNTVFIKWLKSISANWFLITLFCSQRGLPNEERLDLAFALVNIE